MEENKNTENEKKKEKNSDKDKFNLTDFINVHKAEFKKIVWPSKDELLKQTGTVIVVSLIVGLLIFAYDSAISFTYEKTMNMVKGSSENVVKPTVESEVTDDTNAGENETGVLDEINVDTDSNGSNEEEADSLNEGSARENDSSKDNNEPSSAN